MSGIYIKSELPKSGQRISILSDGHAYYEDMTNPFIDLGKVTVIPDGHGRLVDVDAFMNSLATLLRFPSNLVNGQWIVNTIREQPTIIPSDKEVPDG